MKKIVLVVMSIMILTMMFVGCDTDSRPAGGAKQDQQNQQAVADKLQSNQATPTDIEYSLERYNLIRREYWVNGLTEKARTLPCPVTKPMGYIVLFEQGVGVVGRYCVDGKVSSLNNWLTPLSEYYEVAYGDVTASTYNKWLADVDGCYGTNVEGIFFFTTDGNYIEWTGDHFYCDIPVNVENPILQVQTVGGN
jgi:hypothetical protein